jgi:PAS domain-containing protein
MFESMSSGVLVCIGVDGGGDFVITDMNRSAEEITRVSRTAAAGLSFAAVFPGVPRIGLYEVLARVWQTGSPEALSARLYEDVCAGIPAQVTLTGRLR